MAITGIICQVVERGTLGRIPYFKNAAGKSSGFGSTRFKRT
jgi:hypothetical protein